MHICDATSYSANEGIWLDVVSIGVRARMAPYLLLGFFTRCGWLAILVSLFRPRSQQVVSTLIARRLHSPLHKGQVVQYFDRKPEGSQFIGVRFERPQTNNWMAVL